MLDGKIIGAPDLDSAVGCRTHKMAIVRREGEGGGKVAPTGTAQQLRGFIRGATSISIPDECDFVFSATDQLASIGREGHAMNSAGVTLCRLGERPIGRVPDLQVAIVSARRKTLSIERKCHRPNRIEKSAK